MSVRIIIAALLGAAPLCAAAAPFTLTTVYEFNGTSGGGGSMNDNILPIGKYLYGTTNGGGLNGNGVIYRVNLATRVQKVLYTFTGASDGCYPNGLTMYKGILYGTAIGCGAGGYGSVFSVDPASGAYHTIYSFQNGADGSYPQGNLLDFGGALWGTADFGGTNGAGTLFKIDPATGTLTPLYSFGAGNDAAQPPNGLIAVNNVLYGVTQFGGTNNTGAVYAYNPTTGTESVLYSFGPFGGTDGYRPASPLLFAFGALYGTAQAGGTRNNGVIFRVDLKTGVEEVVYNFSGGVDGATPYNGLSYIPGQRASGIVYSVASEGGSKDEGNIFSFNLITKKLTTLYSFKGGTDGYLPYSQLTYSNGTFYGNTAGGGLSAQSGTIFSFKP